MNPTPPRQSDPTQTPSPQVVYVTRPLNPEQAPISDEVRRKHEAAKAAYPELNLSAGEYVITAVRRHVIGLISIWSVVGIVVLLALVFIPIYAVNRDNFTQGFGGAELPSAVMLLPFFLLLTILFGLGGLIATIVYRGNKFFLTNESVTQFIQHSLFSKKEQTVSLANIEDASFDQHGILQHLLNYGSLRLSTEGDETTYRFHYVARPREQVAILNNAVEAFKNGRPVESN